jgi:hypothetical protein
LSVHLSVYLSVYVSVHISPIRKHSSWLPPSNNGCKKPNNKCSTIEHHMKSIGNETQTIRPNSIEQLNTSKSLPESAAS